MTGASLVESVKRAFGKLLPPSRRSKRMARGLAYRLYEQVAEHVAAGRPNRVLEDRRSVTQGLHIYFPAASTRIQPLTLPFEAVGSVGRPHT